MADGRIIIDTELNDDGLRGGLDGLRGQMSGVAKQFGAAVAGAFAVDKIVEFASQVARVGIEYNAFQENANVTWTTLLGSQEKAKVMLEDIGRFAATTPFEKMGVNEMAIQLHNAGFEGQALFDQLTKFGDMAGAFGIQSDSLQEMVRQYAQVQQAGVAYTEDLNILQDRGIPIYKALAEELGISTAEVKKWASEGKISADVYQAALDRVAASCEGGMQKQSQTFTGMISTLKDSLSQLARLITEDLFNAMKTALSGILPVLEQFVGLMSEQGLAGALITMYPQYAEAINGLSILFQGLVLVFQAVANGIGVLIMSLAGAIAGIGLIIGYIINFFAVTIPQAFATLGTSLMRIFTSIYTTVVTCWNNIMNFFMVTIPQIINIIITWFSQLPSKLGRKFMECVNKARQWATNTVNAMRTGAQNAVNAVIQWFSQLPGKIRSKLTEIINKVRSWATQLRAKGTEAARNFSNAVTNGLAGLPGKMVSIGVQVAEGLANGIKSAVGKVIEAAKNLVTSAINAAKEALDINSPSRVARDVIGVNYSLGIAEGIDNENAPIKASKRLAKNLITGIDIPKSVKKLKSAIRFGIDKPSNVTTYNNKSDKTDTKVINQTNNFYSKTESPAQTARKIKKVSKELLYG